MKSFILAALLLASTAAMAAQTISCPRGTSPGDNTLWASVQLTGNSATVKSNLMGVPNGIVDETMKRAVRANESQYADVVYVSRTDDSQNDSDFTYKLAFSKELLGANDAAATIFIYSKSFMPGENGSSFSTKFTGCTTRVE